MPIIRWRPRSLFDEDWSIPTIPGLSRLMGQGLNLYETEDEFIAEAATPGIPEENIDVSVEEGVVRISGSSQVTKEDKGRRSYFMNAISSTYDYSFQLPSGLEEEEPKAELHRGILTLRFKKTRKEAPKKVKIVSRDEEEKKSL